MRVFFLILFCCICFFIIFSLLEYLRSFVEASANFRCKHFRNFFESHFSLFMFFSLSLFFIIFLFCLCVLVCLWVWVWVRARVSMLTVTAEAVRISVRSLDGGWAKDMMMRSGPIDFFFFFFFCWGLGESHSTFYND